MQTLYLKASIDELTKVNALLEQTITQSFLPLLFKAQLIVEELVINICNYAYKNTTGNFSIACGIANFDGQNAVYICIKDEGLPYDPFLNDHIADTTSSLEQRPIGGLGLHLVKEYASHYSYCRIDNCNQTQIFLTTD